MKRLIGLLLFTVMASGAQALDVPQNGRYDYRVKYVDYNPGDVVKLVAHYGYQVDIVFEEGETVAPRGIYMGDGDAWTFGTLNNHLYVKPKEQGGQTNMAVQTNRRSYTFELSAHWPKKNLPTSNDMYFQVNFRYPETEAKKAAVLAAAAAERERFAKLMSQGLPPRNWNYWVQGSEVLAPDEAFDDGRFTYLTFKGNRDIPAIFIVNEDGSESLINRHVNGDTVVIQAIGKKFVLRKGASVACVFNESFDAVGVGAPTGTTIPGVERVIRGETQQ